MSQILRLYISGVSTSVNACLEVHHSLRAKVHQFKTYF